MVRIVIGDSDLDLYPNTVIPLTVKYYELRNLTTRYVNFSPQIRVPNTANNRTLLGLSGEEKSLSSIPYQTNSVKLIIDNIEVNDYEFTVISVKDQIRIQFFGTESAFFNAMQGKTLEDLPVTGLTSRTYDSTANKKTTTEFVNPLISYNEDLTLSSTRPGFYYKSILDLFEDFTSKTFSGSILSDTRLTKTFMPYCREKDVSEDPAFFASKEVAALSAGETISLTTGNQKLTFDNIISQGSDGFWDGDTYTVTQPLTASAYYTFNVRVRLKSTSTGFGADFNLFVNGSLVESIGSGNDIVFQNTTPIAGQDGITMSIRATTSALPSSVTMDPESYLEVRVVEIVDTDYLIESAKSLFPAIPMKDFIQDFAFRHGIIFKETSNTIALKTFNEVINDKSNAVDWSEKRNYLEEQETEYKQKGVSQSNIFSYETADDIDEEIGQGEFTISNTLLPLVSEITSIFSNTGDAFDDTEKVNFLVIPAIKDGETDFELSGYRLAMVKENPEDATQWTTYFIDESESKDLGFNGYITDHYSRLVASLQKSKVVTRSYKLNSNDVLNFDPHKLIYDDGAYYLVNEIKNFVAGIPTVVEMLKVL